MQINIVVLNLLKSLPTKNSNSNLILKYSHALLTLEGKTRSTDYNKLKLPLNFSNVKLTSS